MSLRSSLAMGSVTPLTQAVTDVLLVSPPKVVWVMDSSSCWIFSKMNTCQCGEKQVRGISFTPLSGDLIICHILTVCVGRCVSGFCAGVCGFNTSVWNSETNCSRCLNSLVKLLFLVCYSDHTLFVTSVDETSFEAGIKVQIHSQDEPSFIDQLGFGVAPGFQTFVSCQEQRVLLHVVSVKG